MPDTFRADVADGPETDAGMRRELFPRGGCPSQSVVAEPKVGDGVVVDLSDQVAVAGAAVEQIRATQSASDIRPVVLTSVSCGTAERRSTAATAAAGPCRS